MKAQRLVPWFLLSSLLVFAPGWNPEARAAQSALVNVEGAELRQGPGSSYPVIETMHRGAKIMASNVATSGFYKVRSPSGTIGWVSADSLDLGAANGGGAKSSASGGSRYRYRPASSTRTGQDQVDKHWRLAALFNLNLFSVGDVNTQLGLQGGLTNGNGFGGEFGYRFSPYFALLARVESMSRSLSVTDQNGNPFTLSISALPIMVGPEFDLFPSWSAMQSLRQNNLFLRFAALVGTASPKFSSVATAQATPNETDYSGSGLTFLGKLNLDWQLSSTFGLFFETGYRYLKAANTKQTVTGAGSNIFNAPGTTTPVTLNLDMSGIFFGAGASVSF